MSDFEYGLTRYDSLQAVRAIQLDEALLITSAFLGCHQINIDLVSVGPIAGPTCNITPLFGTDNLEVTPRKPAVVQDDKFSVCISWQ